MIRMNPLLRTTLLSASLAASLACMAQQDVRSMEKLIRDDLRFAQAQYKLLIKNTPADLMPRSFNAKENKLITSNTEWWTSGFFPGTLWNIYHFTRDTLLRQEAERRLALLEKEKYNKGTHDLGFMMYCSFGNAYRITGKEEYKEVILTSAESLMGRYRPSIHSLQSWDSSAAFRCPVIIDNMMNLELLCWASDEMREPKYKVVAIDHTNTTIRNHFRPDFSSYHVVDYDLSTGKPIAKKTAQGFSDESAWARGQSWGLYGFTVMYRFTNEKKYLEQARGIANFLLHHPKLPKDKIPYWDYNATDDPSTNMKEPNDYRDVSAGAIMASALLELAQYVEEKEQAEYVSVAKTILRSLSSKKYRNKLGENGGFLLKHSVGSLPHHSEIDVPLTYADYYFIEALLRYQGWYLAK